MYKSILKVIIVLIFILLSTLNIFPHELDIAADNLEYIEYYDKLNAKGNAVLNWKDEKVYADYIEFIIDEQILSAYGNVKIEEGDNIIHANSATYNYDLETGIIKEVFGYHLNMFIRAKSMKMQEKNVFTMENMRLSNCDLDNPHTYIMAKHGKFTLGGRITIYDAILYIGKIPVFYFPIATNFLFRSIRIFGSEIKFKFIPWYHNKFHLRTAISCSLNEFLIAKVNSNFSCNKINDYSVKVNYAKKNAKGNIYVYTTKDSLANKKKNIQFDYSNIINNQWTIRSKGIFKNGRNFNRDDNLYDLDITDNLHNLSITDNFLSSYISITRQDQDTNLRFDIKYTDIYDRIMFDHRTGTQISTLPNIKFVYFPKEIFLGIIHKLNFQYSNTLEKYNFLDHIYKNKSSLSYNLTKNFKFGKNFTLKPNLEIIEDWCNKNNLDFIKNNFYTKYEGSINSRFRIANWVDWNANYFLKVNPKNDFSYKPEIEINRFVFDNNIYIGDKTTISNIIERDLAQKPTQTSLATELEWTPKHCMIVHAKQAQFIKPYKFKSFQVDTKIEEPKKMYLNFGIFCQNYYDDKVFYGDYKMDNVLGFGIWLTSKWKLNYNMKIASKGINEYELNFYRDLHCYDFYMGLNMNKNKPKIYLKFTIKPDLLFIKSKENYYH
jgi:LPS-assembly protein